MNIIVKAKVSDAEVLAELSIKAFLVPHGHSAPKKDVNAYISNHFNKEYLAKELANPKFQYYLIYHQEKLAGFSKVIFNTPNENVSAQNITKMERLYLLKEFYGLQLGLELMNFNISLAKENKQAGIWLAVWVENHRAISFYQKIGMQKVGSFDFKISETHYNPNHIMYLSF